MSLYNILRSSMDPVQIYYNSFTGTTMLSIVALIDLIFLLGISKQSHFAHYTEILLLVHGSVFILIHLFYYVNVISILVLLLFIMNIILFVCLTKEGYVNKIICVTNCMFLCGIVEKSILGVMIFTPRYIIGTITITILLIVILCITKYTLLLQVHTVLNCYLVSAYLVSNLTGIKMLSGAYDIATYGTSFLIGLWLLFGIVFIEFVI